MMARERIANERDWCRGQMHINGQACAIAALEDVGVVVFGECASAELEYLHAAAGDVADGQFAPGMAATAINVNDYLGHAAVLAMYDLAISAAMSDEAME
jgi:hypothetical protein